MGGGRPLTASCLTNQLSLSTGSMSGRMGSPWKKSGTSTRNPLAPIQSASFLDAQTMTSLHSFGLMCIECYSQRQCSTFGLHSPHQCITPNSFEKYDKVCQYLWWTTTNFKPLQWMDLFARLMCHMRSS